MKRRILVYEALIYECMRPYEVVVGYGTLLDPLWVAKPLVKLLLVLFRHRHSFTPNAHEVTSLQSHGYEAARC